MGWGGQGGTHTHDHTHDHTLTLTGLTHSQKAAFKHFELMPRQHANTRQEDVRTTQSESD